MIMIAGLPQLIELCLSASFYYKRAFSFSAKFLFLYILNGAWHGVFTLLAKGGCFHG
ncbi:hypothetical protein PTUN_a4113 [Pseudoalteromonas tunicata]|jgi:hypothetical protein|uniref:Uncharacterized protein n=1 Tax=Pseudoalteromonas tunicata D2 TaxID=87626 RepID=A4CDY2_9GAMM|nr:hypothetical protein PTUN_a4113 [Pseudoalteromonas tunicata]EAR27174.1 hypothetical protein PTD2_05870 [Pseudoalteromonas tunicata D2]